MADSVKLGDLFAEHQATLQLSPLAGDLPTNLRPVPGSGFWVGNYNGIDRHCIEIIDRESLAVFTHALQAEARERHSGRGHSDPGLVIFTDDTACPDTLLAALRRLNLTAYHSPLPARTILRILGNELGRNGACRDDHAVALSVFGHGVLIRGNSGLGKSAIALELLSRGHALVADDLPLLARMPMSDRVFATCPPMLADLLEVRALGVLDVCKLFGSHATLPLCPIDLVIELVENYHADAESRLSPFRQRSNILGVDITRVPVPVGHATNPAVIVETLAKNHVLYQAGNEPCTSLISRQREQLNKQTL